MKLTVNLCIIFFLALFCLSASCGRRNTRLEFQEAFSNVDNIYVPVDMDAPSESFIYVTSIFGQVFKFANNDSVAQNSVELFFDVNQATGITFFSNAAIGGDEGLTSIEFHPDYPNVPKFYAFYTSSATAIQVTAFSVFSNGTVNYSSADVLLTIPKPLAKEIVQPFGILYEAYLGGDLRFHAEDQDGDDDDDCAGGDDDDDGCQSNLYISTGFGNDLNSAQNTTNLLGKVLRITPSTTGTGYTIPSSNPRVSTFGPVGPVYARGFRNPRKMYFAKILLIYFLVTLVILLMKLTLFERRKIMVGMWLKDVPITDYMPIQSTLILILMLMPSLKVLIMMERLKLSVIECYLLIFTLE